MVKCDSCNEGVCKKSYQDRHLCDDPSNCTCTCQETAGTTFLKNFSSMALGTAAFASGVVLTVTTGGLGTDGLVAVVGGGALTGVGATAVIHPVAKQMNGERMTGKDYTKDLFTVGSIGTITSLIGLGGANVKTFIASEVGTGNLKQEAVELGCCSLIGAISGAVATFIEERIDSISNNQTKFSMINVLKSAVIGAAIGGASHVTGNINNNFDSGVVRSVTKVANDTVSTIVIDASYQIIVYGKVDKKKLALNTGTRAATSAGFEAVSNATYKAHGGKKALREKLGDKKILEGLNSKDREEILKAKEYLENLPPEKVEEQLVVATTSPHIKKEITKVLAQMKDTKEEIHNAQNEEVEQLKIKYQTQVEELKSIGKSNPELMGKMNIHALKDKHIGQFAADLPDEGSESRRGKRRVLFDVKTTKGGTVRYKISGIIENHDYKNAPVYGEVEIPELKVVEPFVLPKKEDEDDNEKKRGKRKLH